MTGYQNLETNLNPTPTLGSLVEKNEKFPRYFKNRKNPKSSEKNEIHAVGYSTHQQLEKNNKKNLDRMREILGADRKKPITQKSVL